MDAVMASVGGAGGPVLVILAILSLVSLTVIIFKAMALFGIRRGREKRATALGLLSHGKIAEARAALTERRSDADRILGKGIDALEAGRMAGLSEALTVEGNAASLGYFRHIKILEVIAMIGPLLGLLGTVLGMIQAFQDLEMAGGSANAAQLAGGIWQALLTTAAGLITALPAAAAAALLSARAEAATVDIEAIIGTLEAATAQASGATC